MGRLTNEHGSKCRVCIDSIRCEDKIKCIDERIYQKLKHYEDLEEAGRLIEVIRCKDCDHYDTYGCSKGAGWCEVNEVGRFDNGYCHLAKLKEVEG